MNQEILSQDTLKVICTPEVQNKIQLLCSFIPHVEWSGILLYKTEGTISKPKDFKIILKDIILMNKGDKTFTGFEWNETKRDNSGNEDRHIDYLDYMDEHHPGLQGTEDDPIFYSLGMIHSHNTMDVFFSPEDVEELHDNAPNHNIYLSFIVNNNLDYTARVAYTVEADEDVEIKYKAKDENGLVYNITNGYERIKKKILYYHECEIEKPAVVELKEDFFMKNLKDVLVKADSKTTNRQTFYNNSQPKSYLKPTEPLKSRFKNSVLFSEQLEDIKSYDKVIQHITTMFLLNSAYTRTSQGLGTPTLTALDIFNKNSSANLNEAINSGIDKLFMAYKANVLNMQEYWLFSEIIAQIADIITTLQGSVETELTEILRIKVEEIILEEY